MLLVMKVMIDDGAKHIIHKYITSARTVDLDFFVRFTCCVNETLWNKTEIFQNFLEMRPRLFQKKTP